MEYEHEQIRAEPIRVEPGQALNGVISSDSTYAERFWLPVIGPSALWMHRRLVQLVGKMTTDQYLARAIGIGHRQGRHSAYARCMNRLEQFEWIRQDPGTIVVATRLPLLKRRNLDRLPAELREEHSRHFGGLELDEKLAADGWIPCPVPECITRAKEDDLLGQVTHMREWHPEIVAARQAESARWDGWVLD